MIARPLVDVKRPTDLDQALAWSQTAAAAALPAAVSVSEQLICSDSSQRDEVGSQGLMLLKLAYEAGYYAGLADPLENHHEDQIDLPLPQGRPQ